MNLILIFVFSFNLYGQFENLKKTERLVKLGDAEAQYFLASEYHNPENDIYDLKQAFFWFKNSAQQGDSEA